MSKIHYISAIICFIGLPLHAQVVVDQFGYQSDQPKTAIYKVPVEGQDAGQNQPEPGSTFFVRNIETDEVVFEGDVVSWNNGTVHQQSGDRVWHMDFSDVTQSGYYRIEKPETGEVSHPFEIRDNPWYAVMRAAVRTFFYQRSGFEKEARFAGENWGDPAAYLQEKETRDYFDQNNPDRFRDLHGGWFDAGDFNKYITFTSSAVHPLLTAYRLNPHIWDDNYNIPESGNDLPDLLDELKWQLDWILRMQVEDGGVIIKMGQKEYYSATPPSSDNRDRYYGRVCTSSTISFASMVAHAALVYREFPEWEAFADTMIQAGLDAWENYSAQETLQTNCDQYEIKSGDADRTEESQRMEEILYGIYMFALTGDETWNDLIRQRFQEVPLLGWWGPYNHYLGEGLLFYTTLDGADESVKRAVLNAFESRPSPFYGDVKHIYPWFAGMPDSQYHWGSLVVMANTAILNLNVARYLNRTDEDEHIQRARDILHYIHGRNPLDKAYLSNMYAYGAENPVNEFYHGWFEHGSPWQNVLFSEKGGPAPGFLVGGPNQAYGGDPNPYLEHDQPPQKMYTDFNYGWPYNSWEITENSIGYQAGYVRLLSEFISLSSDTIRYSADIPGQENNDDPDEPGPDIPQSFNLDQNFPNPFNPATTIRFSVSEPVNIRITVYDARGRKVATLHDQARPRGEHSIQFDASGLSSGLYIYRMQAGNFVQNRKMMLIK